MAIKESLLPEFDNEMSTTRKLLERIPFGDAEWKPHTKSFSMFDLAGHIINIPTWADIALNSSSLDMGTEPPPQPAFTSTEEIVAAFDKNVASARAVISSKSDPEMLESWTLKKEGKDLLTLPKVAVVRGFVLNHIIHHRGQLSVYLRLKDVALPSIYGPSADDPGGF
jgi:uncharacterized damage-inducible protein DinB